uniref:EF-hand calcium-binding domain-containing protein 13 n=1 Tax=Jaculus jaculus TaxID=51337 RepID=UPI001E1B3CF3|nr:EF-hand calcium-binding domain-containing protein 13 [Jaculus jaculus]
MTFDYSQEEENIDLMCSGSDSLTTNLPTINIEKKKYINISKTVRKKNSPEIRDTEHKKTYETSLFLSKEEKYYEFSREKKVQRKRNLQIQLHSKRTEGCFFDRKKETPSNLSLTLYEAVPEAYLQFQELSGLARACKIFSKVRSGKIYVNDLPMVLHTLKISMSDSEMRQILKTVDIDAFQDALKTFHRIQGGRVATAEVADVLESMDVSISPEVFEEILRYTYVDSNNMVDIGDVVFRLDDLQQQYEDIAITDGSVVDEDTLSRRVSTISGQYEPYRKKSSLLSRSFDHSLSKRLNIVPPEYQSKILKENDDLEPKQSKTSPVRKLSSVTESKYVGLQEPYSKYDINAKKLSEKAEIHDSKSKPHSLKSTTSLSKFLDKSDIYNIPESQKPAVRRRSTILKPVSSKERAPVNTLENVFEAISKLQEDYISPEELKSVLPSLGITLSDTVFQKIVSDTPQNENGMVNLDDFIMAVSKEQSFPEYEVLTDVIKGLDKIQDDSVNYEDLKSCIQNFGVYLSKPEFRNIMDLMKVDDETNKVNFKEFVNTMMNNTECFSEKLQLLDAIENLNTFSKEQVDVSDLWNTLSNMNNNLKKDEFLDALKLATVDDDKVQFGEFAKIVKNLHDTSRLEGLHQIALALDSLGGNKIEGKNLENFLRNIGIKLPKEEVEKILQSDIVSEDNVMNVNDCVKALRDTQKFSNFIEFRNEAISTNLKLPEVNEIKEAAEILTHTDNGKIAISDLEHALKCLNVNVTEKDLSDILKSCDINDKMEVDLKDFLMEMKETPQFQQSKATQLLLATAQTVQNDIVDVSELKTLLLNDGFQTANSILTEVLKNVPEHEYGKVTIQELMTKFCDVLAPPEVTREKFYNADINRNDLKAIPDIQQRLNAIGIHLRDDEIQKFLDNTNPDDEVVQFKQFIQELANTDEFNECQRIEDTWNVVNCIADGKIDVKDLLSILECLKEIISEEDQPAGSAMDEKNMALKAIVDDLISSPSLSTPFHNLFKEVTTLENIRKNKMPASELSSKLLSSGVPVSYKTLQELMRQASIEENDEVSLGQLLENLKASKPNPVLEDIKNAFNAVYLMNSDRIPLGNLKEALDDLNIILEPEEYQLLEEILDVDEKREISQKAALLALKNNKRFQDYRDESKVNFKDYLSKMRQMPHFTNSSKMKDPLKVLSSIRKNVVNPGDFVSMMKKLGIPLTEELMERAMKDMAVREDGTVNLEELISHLVSSEFPSVPESKIFKLNLD